MHQLRRDTALMTLLEEQRPDSRELVLKRILECCDVQDGLDSQDILDG